MKKITPSFVLLWAKRFLCYLTGRFSIAVGVVFSVKSALGVSPVSCLANVVYQILGVDRGLTVFSLGLCTTLTYFCYILVELLILRRDFKAHMLLQVIASTIFGSLISAAGALLAAVPAPESYGMRLVFLCISMPFIAFGVMLYVAPGILPMPGEGLSLAISRKTGRHLGECKVIADCGMVASAVILSLAYFRGLVGVREGTVISALLVGFIMKFFMRIMNEKLLRFVQREKKQSVGLRTENSVV